MCFVLGCGPNSVKGLILYCAPGVSLHLEVNNQATWILFFLEHSCLLQGDLSIVSGYQSSKSANLFCPSSPRGCLPIKHLPHLLSKKGNCPFLNAYFYALFQSWLLIHHYSVLCCWLYFYKCKPHLSASDASLAHSLPVADWPSRNNVCKDFCVPEAWWDSVDGTGGDTGPKGADRQYLLAPIFGLAADALLGPCHSIERSLCWAWS